jgi:hypothetical protein
MSQITNYVVAVAPPVAGTEAFSYFQTAGTTAGVTGNGAAYTLLCDGALVASVNYNAGTGMYTAPNTGTYLFTLTVAATNIAATMTYGQVILMTTAHAYSAAAEQSPFTAGTVAITQQWSNTASMIVPMTAGDTASVQVIIGGGPGNTAQIQGGVGSNTVFSMFSGCQIA